jgi:hypothetical protein
MCMNICDIVLTTQSSKVTEAAEMNNHETMLFYHNKSMFKMLNEDQ